MTPPQTIPVVVAGAAGRMGRCLVAAVKQHPGLKLTGALEAPGHPDLEKDAGALAGLGPIGVAVTGALAPLLGPKTVVIDFTTPEATLLHLQDCTRAGHAMVIGTTGLDDAQKALVASAAKSIPIVMAPNMSVGVNLLFHLVEQVARITGPDFDIEIVEAHHRLKKDAPSGTALRLAEIAAAARQWSLADTGKYCRHGLVGERPQREIGVQTIRAGDIVGDHTVIVAGPGERLELTHRAHSRETLAKGAARAVAWIADQRPGLYDMQDVLGLKGS
jgi:4-hydroxy-tetrahydrodipicolinate reductase